MQNHTKKNTTTENKRRPSPEEAFAQNRFPGSFFHAIQQSFDELTQSFNNVLSIDQQNLQPSQY